MQAGAIMILPSYVEAVGELPAKERGEMWRAIIEYATQGAHPALKTPTQRAVFAAIKPSLDYNAGRRKMPTSCRQNADIMQASCGQDDGTPSKEMKKRRKEEMSSTPPTPPVGDGGVRSRPERTPQAAPEPLQPCVDQRALERPVKAWFDRLWAIYPKKQACYPAQAALAAMAWELTEADIDRMEAMIRTNAASAEWTKEGGRYVPRLDRWLASKPWLDGDPGAAKPAQTRRLSPQERAAIDELMGGETA